MYGIKNSVYGIKNSVYGIKNSVYGIKNSVYGIKNSCIRYQKITWVHYTVDTVFKGASVSYSAIV